MERDYKDFEKLKKVSNGVLASAVMKCVVEIIKQREVIVGLEKRIEALEGKADEKVKDKRDGLRGSFMQTENDNKSVC